jgi:hypothetical protein
MHLLTALTGLPNASHTAGTAGSPAAPNCSSPTAGAEHHLHASIEDAERVHLLEGAVSDVRGARSDQHSNLRQRTLASRFRQLLLHEQE